MSEWGSDDEAKTPTAEAQPTVDKPKPRQESAVAAPTVAILPGWVNSNNAKSDTVLTSKSPASGDKDQGDVPERKPIDVYSPVEEELTDNFFKSGIHSGVNFDKYGNMPVKVTGVDGEYKPIASIESANLRPIIVSNLLRMGYETLTPIQKHAFPAILDGRDLMACAQTGSGKTAAFVLPIIQKMLARGEPPLADSGLPQKPKVLVVTPTRELAVQIKNEFRKFSNESWIKTLVVYGGTSMIFQRSQVSNSKLDVLVATPGRLLGFIESNVISLEKIETLVFDEADRMLHMGFINELTSITTHPDMPSQTERQTIMVSATFPDEIQKIASNFLHNYVFISVGETGRACSDVLQTVFEVLNHEKITKLMSLVKDIMSADENKSSKILVFVSRKTTADFVTAHLCQNEIRATSIHGDRYQREREIALSDFKSGSRPIMVATDVVARGIDIPNVSHVFNYDMPCLIEEYVHRIGRTGRMGNLGCAISFYDKRGDGEIAHDLVKVLSNSEQVVPSWLEKQGSLGMTRPGGPGVHPTFRGRDIRQGNDGSAFSNANAALEADEAWD